MINVVNKYKHTPTEDDIYIGRGSVFGNPYSHMDGTKGLYRVATREEAIEKYREWFENERRNNVVLYNALNQMRCAHADGRDINLVCSCAPKPCHGDVIKEYFEDIMRRTGHGRLCSPPKDIKTDFFLID